MDTEVAARFIYDEAELLDRGEYDEWLALFTADARYWAPSHAGQTDPEIEVSLFYEDRALMAARIGRLSHARALGLPTQTSHLIGGVRLLAEGATTVVRSRFQMIEFIDDEQRLYGGALTHHLVEVDGNWKIRLKRVDLVNAGGVFELLQGFF